MSIRAMLQQHDESVLETLTSKGLLRRATRDAASAEPEIIEEAENKATVSLLGETITLDGKGPAACRCTCKAHGLCRHILTAILVMRTQSTPTPENTVDEVISAREQLCELAEETIRKFAGADWQKAVSFLADDPATTLGEEQLNLTVRLTDVDAVVTFIAGKTLRDAAYKGPRTRQRLLTTVAALHVRQSADINVTLSEAEAATVSGLDTNFIDEAQHIIEQAVVATLPSRSLLARDLLLELAISTRCEALPRLSAELRALSRQAQQASERHVDFEPGVFLLAAARSHTLLEAMRSPDSSVALGGSVQRRYEGAESLEAWPLGVARWRSRGGARGLSMYLYEPERKRWLTMINGRAAGADLAFDVNNAYESVAFQAGTIRGLMGKKVHIASPRISTDGTVSGSDKGELSRGELSIADLNTAAVAHDNWGSLRADVANQLGNGIGRRQVPVVALISPSRFGQIGFDEIDQCFRWSVADKNGEPLTLELPAADEEAAMRLWRMGKEISALLIEATLDQQHLSLRPVSVITQESSKIVVLNIDFDRWRVERGLKQRFSRLTERFARPLVSTQVGTNSLNRILDETAEQLASIVSGLPDGRTKGLTSKLDSVGLLTLSRVVGDLEGPADIRKALRAAYMTSELQLLHASRP